mmetsp:Transcript_2795/g.7342  ORF Transcript_2795/g.7342 Transcript_2795/m.7342 type:complete len:205 (+) Transcript_2795:493-1107(+)
MEQSMRKTLFLPCIFPMIALYFISNDALTLTLSALLSRIAFGESYVKHPQKCYLPPKAILPLRVLPPALLEHNHLCIPCDFLHHNIHLRSLHTGQANKRRLGGPQQEDLFPGQCYRVTHGPLGHWFQLVHNDYVIYSYFLLRAVQVNDSKISTGGLACTKGSELRFRPNERPVCVVHGPDAIQSPLGVLVVIFLFFIAVEVVIA